MSSSAWLGLMSPWAGTKLDRVAKTATLAGQYGAGH